MSGFAPILIQGFKDDLFSRKINGVYDVEQEEDEAGLVRYTYVKRTFADRIIEFSHSKQQWEFKATNDKGSAAADAVVAYFVPAKPESPINEAAKLSGVKWFLRDLGLVGSAVKFNEARLVKLTSDEHDIRDYEVAAEKEIKELEALAAKNRDGAKTLLIVGFKGATSHFNGIYDMSPDSLDGAPIYDKRDNLTCLQYSSQFHSWHFTHASQRGLANEFMVNVPCLRPIAPEIIPISLLEKSKAQVSSGFVIIDSIRIYRETDPQFAEFVSKSKAEDELVAQNRLGAKKLHIDGFTETYSARAHGVYEMTDDEHDGAPVYEKMGNNHFRVKFCNAVAQPPTPAGWCFYINDGVIARLLSHKAFSPEIVPNPCWRQWDNSKFIDAPKVKITPDADPRFAALEAKAKEEMEKVAESRKDSSKVLYLYGHTGTNSTSVNGIFTMTEESWNDAPVYAKDIKKGEKNIFLQYDGSAWLLGLEKFKTACMAKLASTLPFAPEMVSPTVWKVYDGKSYLDSKLTIAKAGDKIFDDYVSNEALEAEWVAKNKEGAQTLLLKGATGSNAKRINGIYDIVKEEESFGGPVYIKRDKKQAIWFWNNEEETMPSLRHGPVEDKGAAVCTGYLMCKKPLPLEMIRPSVWKVWDNSWSEQPSLKVITAQDEIDKWIKQEEEQKEKNKLHADFILSEQLSFDDDASVDEMKIQTMYKMVEDVTVQWGGRDISKKVLYLTNKQANMFDDTSMQRCIQALEVPEPKFVIILLPSTGDSVQNRKAHTEMTTEKSAYITYWASYYQCSEVNSSDEDTVRTSVIMFMKNCILPLAKQTKALIIVQGANDCFLTAALANVVLEEQARLGKDCPFSVVALCWEFEVHYKGVLNKESGSLAGQIARGCSAWRKRVPVLERLMYEKQDRESLQQCDLTPAASRYIVFESMDKEGKTQSSFLKTFKSTLIQCLTKTLPSIAIQSHSIQNIGYLNDLLARNIPVLLLDTTERSFSARRGESTTHQGLTTVLARQSDAFPKISEQRASEILQPTDDMGAIEISARHALLDIAEEMVERKWITLKRYQTCDSLSCPQLAFFHSVVSFGASSKMSAKPLWERIAELEKFERENKESKRFVVHPELATRVVIFLRKRELALSWEATKIKAESWLSANPKHNLAPRAKGSIDGNIKKQIDEIKSNNGVLEGENSSTFLLYMELISNPLTFSGSVHSIEDLEQIMRSVAKIDRLPTSNTLEALRTLQDAWDHIEIYNQVASSYKLVAKVTYVFLILIGVTITLAALVELQTNLFSSRVPILVLSLAGTAIVGYTSFVNPAVRWQQLRVASLSIETNIWQFRSRAGPYRTDHGSDGDAHHLLAQTLRFIKASVLEGADIKSTAFYSRSQPTNKHKQHDDMKARSARSFSSTLRVMDCFLWLVGKDAKPQSKYRPKPPVSRQAVMPTSAALLNEMDSIVSAKVKQATLSPTKSSIQDGTSSDKDGVASDRGSDSGSASAANSVVSASSPASKWATTPPALSSALHAHPLTKTSRTTKWNCDGRHTPGGCRSGSNGEEFPVKSNSWFCKDCNFDLCIGCVRQAVNKPLPVEIECSAHHHPLVKSTGYKGTSYDCAQRFTRDGCKGGESEEKTIGFAWRCAECNFNVCPHCIDHLRAQPYTPPTVPLEHVLSRLRQDDNEYVNHLDDHYAPLQPDAYLSFRINTALAFYKDKIPKCTRTRNISQALLILGSLGTAAIAFANQSAWAAVITIVTSGITAFLEYQGTNSKISRYSSTVHALQELVLWWQTLPAIEKSSITNIDHLIMASEELLQREQQAWKSTSQAIKLLRKETGGGKEENA